MILSSAESDSNMTDTKDLLPLFKTVAERVDRRGFETVTRESVITDLGIDSLSMMQIVGEMETELSIQIPDEDLVEIVTVGDLCSKVERRVG